MPDGPDLTRPGLLAGCWQPVLEGGRASSSKIAELISSRFMPLNAWQTVGHRRRRFVGFCILPTYLLGQNAATVCLGRGCAGDSNGGGGGGAASDDMRPCHDSGRGVLARQGPQPRHYSRGGRKQTGSRSARRSHVTILERWQCHVERVLGAATEAEDGRWNTQPQM